VNAIEPLSQPAQRIFKDRRMVSGGSGGGIEPATFGSRVKRAKAHRGWYVGAYKLCVIRTDGLIKPPGSNRRLPAQHRPRSFPCRRKRSHMRRIETRRGAGSIHKNPDTSLEGVLALT